MQPILPAPAIVRPRVTTRESGDSRPLEEVVQELAEERCEEIVWIVGGPGSGKSNALAHLAAVFADDDRVVFYDEPKPFEIGVHGSTQLVVATTSTSAARNGTVLLLQSWGIDEMVEYLLGLFPDSCRSVIDRLGTAAHQRWAPQVASIVLKRFADDPLLEDVSHALVAEMHERFPKRKQFLAAAKFCLVSLIGGSARIEDATRLTAKMGCSPENLRGPNNTSYISPKL